MQSSKIKERVLVVGSTGQVGPEIVRLLKQEDYDVRDKTKHSTLQVLNL